MRIAIVHDWLDTYAGGERVLEALLELWPEASLFSLVDFMPQPERAFLGQRAVHTSFLQRLPFARKHFRKYLPLMPVAVEQFDFTGFDLVISNCHAVAKGVITGPDQLHVCLCYTPIRYAWELSHQYLREAGLDRGPSGVLARWQLHRLRQWDLRTINGVDEFLAISHYIAARIGKTYRREAKVVYPPVDVDRFTPDAVTTREPYYVSVSRFTPYKRQDLLVEAFNTMPDRRLILVGDGETRVACMRRAGPNITFLGHQPFDVVLQHLRRARAFLFAADEDFGIAPLEAQACGTPVIAYGKGGTLETVRGLEDARPTGVFFDTQRADAVVTATRVFEANAARIDASACRDNALRFSRQAFLTNMRAAVQAAWASHQATRTARPTMQLH